MKRTLIVALACFLITATGCGAKKHVAIPNSTTTPSLTGSPADNAVLRNYRAFWADFEAVTLTMMPGNPQIATHATGDELTQLNNIVLVGHQSGSVYRGVLDLHPHLRSVIGDTAVVDDCYIDHTGKYVVASGERLDKEDLTPQTVVVTLKQINGTWMTANIDDRTASCVPS